MFWSDKTWNWPWKRDITEQKLFELCCITFLRAVSSFFRARHLYIRENTKEHSRLIKYWSNFDVLSKVFAQKLYFLPHFLGFHAISPVFMQIWKVFLKFGLNYTIKVGAQLGRTIFSALGDLLKIDSGRDPNLIIDWKKCPRTPGGKSGTSKTPLNTLTGLAPLIWCIFDYLDVFSDSQSCPKGHFLHQKLP